MKIEEMLEVQAHADGELEAGRRVEVERRLREDAGVRELHERLVRVRDQVRLGEPQFAVPETREFYWSQIQRRLAGTRPEPTSPRGSMALNWMRWLAPALGLAAVALVLVVQDGTPAASGDDRPATVSMAHAEVTSVVYRSDSTGATIHWIN